MKSIIKEIYYGNRGYNESITMSKEYFNILGEISRLYDVIEKRLSAEDKINFKKYCDLRDELEGESAEVHYAEGLKLGILLGVESCD